MVKRRKTSDSSGSEPETTVKREEDSSSSTSDEDGEWNVKGESKVKKKRGRPVKRQVKVEVKQEEEKEEGEVEDDDEEDEYSEFNDGYDDNLLGDEADQERLAQMTEKEREQELFNRSEKREVLRTRFEIEKKLRLQKKKLQQSNKSSEASARSNERRRNMEDKRKVKDAIKGLREQREKKKQKQQKLRAEDIWSSSSDDENEKPNKRSSSTSSSSSSSSSDESDTENKGRKRRDSGDEDKDDFNDAELDKELLEDYVLTVGDLNSIRLTRKHLEKWCYAPFFLDTVSSCFIRIGIGNDKMGSPVYRVTQITEVSEGPKSYQLIGDKGSVGTRTNKVLKLKNGNDVRNFRMEYVSNQDFSPEEFEEWKSRMERDRVELPTKELIEKKRKDIKSANDYCYKESDVDTIVREKERFKESPVNFAVKKTELLKQKEMAQQLQDHGEVERIMQQIDELEEKAKEIDLKRTQNISGISYINERNRMRNIIEAERAIMEEREKNQSGEQSDDPFRRRKCTPMLVHKHKNKPLNASQGSVDENSGFIKKEPDSTPTRDGKESNDTPMATPISNIKQEKSPGSPKANDTSNDPFSAHNFDIQIDFDSNVGINTPSNHTINHSSSYLSSNNHSSSSSKPTNRRSLNLEEYKKKKGLI